jgi:ABC-type sugar transport system substrate-binding protein
MNSKARLLLVAFPLLLPAAARIARHSTLTVIIITSAYALASGWFSAYSLTVWRYAI